MIATLAKAMVRMIKTAPPIQINCLPAKEDNEN